MTGVSNIPEIGNPYGAFGYAPTNVGEILDPVTQTSTGQTDTGTYAPAGNPAGTWYLGLMPGATDDAKMQAALAAWAANAKGGTIVVPTNVGPMTSQWLIGNDGASPPLNKHLRITGAGNWKSGNSSAFDSPGGGTVIDFTYNGAGAAKIDTRGHGAIEIDHVAFTDSSGGNLPFFQTTLTTPDIHHCSFLGSKTGIACDQDAIILGGGGDAIDRTSTAKFDGYGGGIYNNFFDGIRECVRVNPAGNAVPIYANTAWSHCGAPSTAYAAFHLVGDAAKAVTGVMLGWNTIEMVGYFAGIILGQYAKNNQLAWNHFYDTGPHTVYFVYADDNTAGNDVFEGHSDDTIVYLQSSPLSYGRNTDHTAHAGQKSRIGSSTRFNASVEFASNSGFGPATYGNRGARARWRTTEVTGNGVGIATICVTPATQVSDAVPNNGSTRITSAGNGFSTAVAGATIGGTNIPSNTLIAAVGPAGAYVDINNAATGGDGITTQSVFFAGSGTELTMTSFKDHHIESSGSTPSIAADTALNNSSGASLTGTDMAGTVTLTPGGAPTAGQLCHWAPAINWTAAARIAITAKNAAAQAAGLYATTATNSIAILCANAPTGPVTFDYVCIK